MGVVAVAAGSNEMKQNTRRGVFVLGGYQEVRSRITKYICSSSTPNLLSVLDPGSPVLRHGSALRFPDGSKAVCFLSRPLRKNPQEGIFTRWAATGNIDPYRVSTPIGSIISQAHNRAQSGFDSRNAFLKKRCAR